MKRYLIALAVLTLAWIPITQARASAYVRASTAASVTLAANPTSVTAGNTTTLTWHSAYTLSCVSFGGSGGWTHSVTTRSGRKTITPTATARYAIRCKNKTSVATAYTTVTVTPVGPPPTTTTTTTTLPPPPVGYKHIILITMENNSYGSIIGNGSAPFINGLANRYGLATNYHNITHNSLPNYLAETSGMNLGQLGPFDNDCTPSSSCQAVDSSIFSQLGPGARSYEESMPSTCDPNNSGEYAPKHNPEVYYTATDCAQTNMPLGSLSNSVLLDNFNNDATAPSFAFVTPNLCNDMHDCSIATGDSWLSSWVGALMNTAAWKAKDTAIFINWDEGEPASAGENCAVNTSDESCHVALLVVAPTVKAGTRDSTYYTHYSLLKTVEDLLNLPELGEAQYATSLVAGFNL